MIYDGLHLGLFCEEPLLFHIFNKEKPLLEISIHHFLSSHHKAWILQTLKVCLFIAWKSLIPFFMGHPVCMYMCVCMCCVCICAFERCCSVKYTVCTLDSSCTTKKINVIRIQNATSNVVCESYYLDSQTTQPLRIF